MGAKLTDLMMPVSHPLLLKLLSGTHLKWYNETFLVLKHIAFLTGLQYWREMHLTPWKETKVKSTTGKLELIHICKKMAVRPGDQLLHRNCIRTEMILSKIFLPATLFVQKRLMYIRKVLLFSSHTMESQFVRNRHGDSTSTLKALY